MRASSTSCIRSPVLVKWWVVLVTRLSTENRRLGVAKKFSRMVETAPVTQPCAAGYSGWLGVLVSGSQWESAVRVGLPLPARMAVTGRQKLNESLAFQQPIPASAYPAHSIANKRAVSEVLRPFSTASLRGK